MTTGVGTNEFTAMEDRDPWAGTPWHKTTPARLEAVRTLSHQLPGRDLGDVEAFAGEGLDGSSTARMSTT